MDPNNIEYPTSHPGEEVIVPVVTEQPVNDLKGPQSSNFNIEEVAPNFVKDIPFLKRFVWSKSSLVIGVFIGALVLPATVSFLALFIAFLGLGLASLALAGMCLLVFGLPFVLPAVLENAMCPPKSISV